MSHFRAFVRTCYACSLWILLGSAALQGYEQGSLLIFEILETPDAQAANDRIAVDSSIFDKTETVEETVTATAQERSEFEIDYTAFGSLTTSAMNTETDLDTSAADEKSGETSLFNLQIEEQQTSLFGE